MGIDGKRLKLTVPLLKLEALSEVRLAPEPEKPIAVNKPELGLIVTNLFVVLLYFTPAVSSVIPSVFFNKIGYSLSSVTPV